MLFALIISCEEKVKSESIEKISESKNGIYIGEKITINSEVLNQNRELLIYLPNSYNDVNRKRNQYPVVYLLDGQDTFVPFIGMLKQYSENNDQKILPEMIVIGIPNIDNNSRMMDFSPTTDGKPERFGGGNKFLQFMKDELFPLVENSYSGSKHRTIVGHSFGGLVVMNALSNHSEMFDNYLMIDGSLYFDNELFLKNKKYSLENKNFKDKNLFIGIANTATYGSSLESIKTDTISANKYVRYSLNLTNQIEDFKINLNSKSIYYKDDTHGSASFLSYKDGFRFFYSWFNFDKEFKYNSKYFIPNKDEDRLANLTKSHFDTVSKRLGYVFKPNKESVSGNAGMLLNWHKQPNQAEELYKLNVDYYPNDISVYKDLSDFYLIQNDTINSIKYNQKVLKLKDKQEL